MLKEQGNTWATILKDNSERRDPTQDKLSSKISITLMRRGVLAYAHINKLMIIAKGEKPYIEHTTK